jgi:hypothetical protein
MKRQTVSLCIVLLVGCLILGLLWNSPSQGQGPAAQAGKVGKYQVAVVITRPGEMTVILCDTETGQMWQNSSGPGGDILPARKNFWNQIASPVPKKK